MNPWTLLADLVVVVHLAWVLYVVVGLLAILVGALANWAWTRGPWFRWSHTAMTLIVAVEGLLGWTCPLTTGERDLRARGGGSIDDASFVGRLARDVLFVDVSQDILNRLYVAFGVLVVLVFWRFPPQRRGARGAGRGARGAGR